MDPQEPPCSQCGKSSAAHPTSESGETCEAYSFAPAEPEELSRNSKLHHEWVRMAVFQNLEMGCSLKTAAYAAGVSPDTLTRWIDRGEEQRAGTRKGHLYRDFLAQVRLAQAKNIQRLQSVVANNSNDDPHLALTQLRALEPDHYNPPERAYIIIQQERESIASVLKRELAHDPNLLRRVFAAIAGVVLPRAAPSAAPAQLVDSSATVTAPAAATVDESATPSPHPGDG